MPRQSLHFGYKITMKSDAQRGYVVSTNNILFPLGVMPDGVNTTRFENAVFQLVTGDGDVTTDILQRKAGEDIKFGQLVRLLHVTTNSFLCSSSRQRASKEKQHQKVTLEHMASDEVVNSKWRIVPRYLVRSEGQKICDQDVIVLQAHLGDAVLHVCSSADAQTDGYHEVNVANIQTTQATGLIIHAYDAGAVEGREFRCGDCLSLNHREERALIRGTGEDRAVIDSALSFRHSDEMSFNINAMFVVESDGVFAGGPVTFGRRKKYRLKLLANGKYLCARTKKGGKDDVKDIEVVLSADVNSPGSVVCFHQAADDPGQTAKSHSRVFLEFPDVARGVWLVNEIVDKLKREPDSPEMSPAGGRKESAASMSPGVSTTNIHALLFATSSAALPPVAVQKPLAVAAEVQHRDGIELIKIPRDEFQQLNFILGLIPPLQKLTDLLSKKQEPPHQLFVQVRDNITTLGRLCTRSHEENLLKREGTPIPKAQIRVMDQRVPHLCMDLVDAVLTEGGPFNKSNLPTLSVVSGWRDATLKYSDFYTLIRLCYKVVRLTCLHNPRAANAMQPIVRLFTHVEESFGAEGALNAIFRDNTALVMTDNLEFVDRTLALVIKHGHKEGKFKRLLSYLCVCKGVALKVPQNHIREKLGLSGADVQNHKCFHRLWIDRDSGRIMINAEGQIGAEEVSERELLDLLLYDNQGRGSRGSFSMESGSSVGLGLGGVNTAATRFAAQLELFIALCKDRNAAGAAAVVRFVPAEVMLAIAKHQDVPGEIRALAIDLFVATQIDVAPSVDMAEEASNMMYLWERGKKEDAAALNKTHGTMLKEQAHSLAMNDNVVMMREFLMEFCIANASMNANDRSQNGVIASALTAVHELTRFALVEFDEFVKWIKAMAPLLDGRDDIPPVQDDAYVRKFGKYSRFRYDEENHNLMEVKLIILRTINMFGDFVRARMQKRLLEVFREGSDIPHMAAVMDFKDDQELDKQSLKKKDARIQRQKVRDGNLLAMGFGALGDVVSGGLGALSAAANAVGSLVGGKKEGPFDYLIELIDVLLDNTQYEYQPVAVQATRTLLSILNVHWSLLTPLRNVLVLPDERTANYYHETRALMTSLEKYKEVVAIPMNQYPYINNTVEQLVMSLGNAQTEKEHYNRQAVLQSMDTHGLLCALCRIACPIPARGVAIERPAPEVIMLLQNALTLVQRLVVGGFITWEVLQNFDLFAAYTPLNVGAAQTVIAMVGNDPDVAASVNESFVSDLCAQLPLRNPLVSHILRLLVSQEATGPVFRNHSILLQALLDTDERLPGCITAHGVICGHHGRRARDKVLADDALTFFWIELLDGIRASLSANTSGLRSDIRGMLFKDSVKIDDCLEVIRNRNLPVYFRNCFVRLFTGLYLEDTMFHQTLIDHGHAEELFSFFLEDVQRVGRDVHGAGALDAWDDPGELHPGGPPPHSAHPTSKDGSGSGTAPKAPRERKALQFVDETGEKLAPVDDDDVEAGLPRDKSVEPKRRMVTSPGQDMEGDLSYFFDAVLPFLQKLIAGPAITLEQPDRGGEEGGKKGEDGSVTGGESPPLVAPTEKKSGDDSPWFQRLKDLADAMADLLNAFYNEYPVAPPPIDASTGKHGKENTIARPEGNSLPERMRSMTEIFFQSVMHLTEPSDKAPVVTFPCIPIEHLQRLAHVVKACEHAGLREPDEATKETIEAVLALRRKGMIEEVEEEEDSFFPFSFNPLSFFTSKEEKEEEEVVYLSKAHELRGKWHKFVDKFADEMEGTNPETQFQTAAIIMLRKAVLGNDAIKHAVRILTLDMTSEDLRAQILMLVKRVLAIEDDELAEASILIKETEKIKESDPGKRFEIEQSILSLTKDQAARQSIVAKWPKPHSLPPKIVEMVSEEHGPQSVGPALDCGVTLMEGGNRDVQDVILAWAMDRTDEQFFMKVRESVMGCGDKLRERYLTLEREIPDPSMRLRKMPEGLSKRLERRFTFERETEMLRFVQLLCEGHNLEFQEYLREQEDNQVSINVLESIMAVLALLTNQIDRHTFDLALQTMSTVTEMLQGPCHGNQEFCVAQNVGQSLTALMSTHYGDLTPHQEIELQKTGADLLLAIMEGHMNVHMISTLTQSIGTKHLVKLMDRVFIKWADENGESLNAHIIIQQLQLVKEFIQGLLFGMDEDDEFGDDLNVSCAIFKFLKSVLDVENLTMRQDPVKYGMEHFSDYNGHTFVELFRMSDTYKVLATKMATIEIVRNNRIERVYFRVPRVTQRNLSKASQEKLIREVQRAGDAVRVADYLERSVGLMSEIEFYEDMRRTPFVSVIYRYAHHLEDLSLLIAFVLNLFLLFTVNHKFKDFHFSHVPPGKNGDTFQAYQALGITQMVLQCLLFVNFFFGPVRIYLETKWTEWQEDQNREAVQESKRSLSIEPPNIQDDARATLWFPLKVFWYVFFIVTWPEMYLRGLYLALSFVGFYITPIVYSFQMLQIVGKFSQLQDVLLSVTLNKVSLGLTSILLFIVVFMFSLVGYFYYSQYLDPEMVGLGGNCDSLLRCTVIYLVYGLKTGGGISEGNTLPPLYTDGAPWHAYGRLAFDFLFFIVLIVIFLNLVFGIILDTFAQLREQREFVDTDQHGKCFICGLERPEFDRVMLGGFENHFKFEHNMWDYFYFLHYVKLKDENDHTGPEGFVRHGLDKHEPTFFPVGRALSIEYASGSSEHQDDSGTAAKRAAVKAANTDGAEEGAEAIEEAAAAAGVSESRLAALEAAVVSQSEKLDEIFGLLKQMVRK